MSAETTKHAIFVTIMALGDSDSFANRLLNNGLLHPLDFELYKLAGEIEFEGIPSQILKKCYLIQSLGFFNSMKLR